MLFFSYFYLIKTCRDGKRLPAHFNWSKKGALFYAYREVFNKFTGLIQFVPVISQGQVHRLYRRFCKIVSLIIL